MLFALLIAGLALGANEGGFELEVVKASSPPVIDGIVEDGEWQGAAVATDFLQYELRRGELWFARGPSSSKMTGQAGWLHGDTLE